MNKSEMVEQYLKLIDYTIDNYLRETNYTAKNEPDEYLTVKESKAVLKVCTTTFYALMKNKPIPKFWAMGSVRFLRSDVVSLLTTEKQKQS
jgi:predicted DNA-binding transcriptional regulator AlpA